MRPLATGITLLLLMALAVPASASQMVRGRLFWVKDPTRGDDPARRRITVIGKEGAPGDGDTIVGDPTAADGGGAFVQIVANGGVGSQVETYPMPARGWRRFPARVSKPLLGYRYVDRAGSAGPVRSAVIKAEEGKFVLKVRIVGSRAPASEPLVGIVPPNPGVSGGALLAISNGDTYCVAFGGAAGGRVRNKPPTPPHDRLFRVDDTHSQPTTEAGCPNTVEPDAFNVLQVFEDADAASHPDLPCVEVANWIALSTPPDLDLGTARLQSSDLDAPDPTGDEIRSLLFAGTLSNFNLVNDIGRTLCSFVSTWDPPLKPLWTVEAPELSPTDDTAVSQNQCENDGYAAFDMCTQQQDALLAAAEPTIPPQDLSDDRDDYPDYTVPEP